MEMTGEQLIPAPRAEVWAALNDPEILRQAIPGCESLERVGENELVATVVAKVGPVKAKFKGKVTLSEIDAPNSYTISGEGQGGVAGFGKGGASVRLEEVAGGTLLRYEAKATVGGKLAQLGSRLIDATARKMADDFFSKFNEVVSGPQAVPEVVAEELASAEVPHPIAPTAAPITPSGRGLPPAIWIGGLILLAVVVLYFYAQQG